MIPTRFVDYALSLTQCALDAVSAGDYTRAFYAGEAAIFFLRDARED